MLDRFAVIDVQAFAARDIKPFGIQSQEMKHGRVQVGYVVAGLQGVKTELVRRTVNVTLFQTSAGKLNRKTVRMVIAAVLASRSFFHRRGAAELGAKDDDGFFQQSAAF